MELKWFEDFVRHRQLVGLRSRRRATGTACSRLRPSGDAGDLGPNLEGLSPGGSILGGADLVTAEQEEVVIFPGFRGRVKRP